MIENVWRKIMMAQPNIERIAFQFWQLQELRNLHPAPGVVDVLHLVQHRRRDQPGEPFVAERHLLLSEVGQLLVGLLVIFAELGVISTHLAPRCEVR